MEIAAWIIVILLFIIGMAGTIYPILPGVIAIYAAFFIYGWMVSFEAFGPWFWTIQTTILVMIIIADYALSAASVKKFGGSKASIIGMTIGLIFGPFIIPLFGIIIGPLVGAIVGELVKTQKLLHAVKVGWGSLVGLFASVVMKILLQGIMIMIFIIWLIMNS